MVRSIKGVLILKKEINIGLLGTGTVGGGVILVLKDHEALITERVGTPIRIKKVLARHPEKVHALDPSLPVVTDIEEITGDPDIDIVVELIGREHPALEYMKKALLAGKNVVTANKDVVAVHGKELFELAAAHHVDFLFEASVAGGIPIIRPLKESLASNRISLIMGIINGTTNYMLTRMTEEHMDFTEVLKQAQEKGYAESDPTADIGGFDAARKIAILSSIAFNTRVHLDEVEIEGIEKISLRDIVYAEELGYTIKLLGIAKQLKNGKISVGVHPTMLRKNHPLASVDDVFNAVYIEGQPIGEPCFMAAVPAVFRRPVRCAEISLNVPVTSVKDAMAGLAVPAMKRKPWRLRRKFSPSFTCAFSSTKRLVYWHRLPVSLANTRSVSSMSCRLVN